MNVRLPVEVMSDCREFAIFKIFIITSLIVPILIEVQVCLARSCLELLNGRFSNFPEITLRLGPSFKLVRVLMFKWLIFWPFQLSIYPRYPLMSKSRHGLEFWQQQPCYLLHFWLCRKCSSLAWLRLSIFWLEAAFPILSTKLLFWSPIFSTSVTPVLVLLKITKAFKE